MKRRGKKQFGAEEVLADSSGPTIAGVAAPKDSNQKRKTDHAREPQSNQVREEEKVEETVAIDDSPNLPGAQHVGGFGAISSTDNGTVIIGDGDSQPQPPPRTSPHVMARAELINDPVVAAQVGAEPTRQEFQELQQKFDAATQQNRRQLCIIIVVVVLAFVGIGGVAVAVVFLVGNDNATSPTPSTEPNDGASSPDPTNIVATPAPAGTTIPSSTADGPTTTPPSLRPTAFPTVFPTPLPTLKSTPFPTTAAPLSIVDFEYLPTPELTWSNAMSPMEQGNKVMYVKSEDVVLATDRDGGIWSFDPYHGMARWSVGAEDLGIAAGFSDGGASVGENASTRFMVYAVSSGIKFGSDATCTIVGLTFDGSVMFQTEPTLGQCVGTPKISGDGEHVFFSHSLHPEAVRNGCFSVVNTADASVYYTFCAGLGQPMSEPGCLNNPALGNYEGGESNTNDICIMGLAPYNGEEGVGTSAMYAFQKPFNPVLQPSITQLLGDNVVRSIEFQLNAPPVIFDNGYSMVVSASRNRILGWFGVPAIEDTSKNRRNRFDRNPTQTPDSVRGSPLVLASYSSPVVSSSGGVFLSGARNEIRAWLDPELNAGNGGTESWKYEYTQPTAALTGAILAPDESRIYFQEGQSGSFFALDAVFGTVVWGPKRPTGGTAFYADFTVHDDGSKMYMGDQTGLVVALILAVSHGP